MNFNERKVLLLCSVEVVNLSMLCPWDER